MRAAVRVLMVGLDCSRSKGGMAQWAKAVLPRLRLRAKIEYVGSYAPGSSATKAVWFALALLRFLLKLPFSDVVHLNVAGPTSLRRKSVFAFAARAAGRPVVLHFHGGAIFRGNEESKNRVVRRLRVLQEFCVFVVLSKKWEEEFRTEVAGASISVVPNPADVGAHLWAFAGVVQFVFAGNITVEKGMQELVSVLKGMKDLEGWRCEVFGDGPLRGWAGIELKDLIEGGRVCLHGWQPPSRFHEALGESGVLVLPSRWEGLPLVVLEAQLVGAPVLASRVGAIPEYIEHDRNGLLFQAGDEEALRAAMLRVVMEPRLLEKYSAKIDKSRVWDSERVAQELVRTYEDARG